jgi:hypothetical protein
MRSPEKRGMHTSSANGVGMPHAIFCHLPLVNGDLLIILRIKLKPILNKRGLYV